MTEWVELTVDDGSSMRAWVARPAAPATRGLLLFQEAFGVNAHIRELAERFAAQGFLTIAPELFHRTAPGFDCPYSEFAKAMPQLEAITEQGLDADARAAYGWLERAGVGDANKTFVDVVFSNADHGFFCDARPSYHAASAAQAWALTTSFLDTYCPRS